MPLRVLHAPTNVGNHAQALAAAERSLGLRSWCVDAEPVYLDYRVDESFARLSPLGREAARWRLLRRALRDFDVVHLNFGRSLLPGGAATLVDREALPRDLLHLPGRVYGRVLELADLPLLRRAGKVVAVTFQGDDARQGTGPQATPLHRRLAAIAGAGYYTERGDALKRRRIDAFDRHAHRIYYLNPDLAAFLPGRARFVPYASVDPAAWRPAAPPGPLRARPLVLHAPTHRGIKGTEHVVAAVERLRGDGVDFDFRLVEGLPHEQARRLYARADLLVDQLLVGWYGGLAVELMALGKPVICAIDEEAARGVVPPGMLRELPIVRATPETIADVLRAALTTERDGYGERAHHSRAYVERWHDPRRIAAELGADYETARASRS